MPIPLGVLAVAGAGGAVAGGNAFELLESQILAGTAASVTFSNLNSTYSGTYQHLQVRVVARSTSGGDGAVNMRARMNNDTGANYAGHRLGGDGSSVFSDAVTSSTFMQAGRVSGSSASTVQYGAAIIDILDPFEANKNRTIRTFSGSRPDIVFLSSGFFNSTAAVTDFTLLLQVGNFAIGSRFSLYGMRSS
jgi:hypothetical protein